MNKRERKSPSTQTSHMRTFGATRSVYTQSTKAQLRLLPDTIRKLLATPPRVDQPRPVTVHGWIRTFRKQKTIAFASVSDGSSIQHLQVVLKPELFAFQKYVYLPRYLSNCPLTVPVSMLEPQCPSQANLYRVRVLGNPWSCTPILSKSSGTAILWYGRLNCLIPC